MPRISALLAALSCTTVLAACSDSGRISLREPTAPSAARGGVASVDGGVRRIEIIDACDPASFDAALGAGSCTRPGGMSFDMFIRQVGAKGQAGAWRFAPGNVEARVGQTLLAINRGGEVHTFIEVEEFGGGVVPVLNELSGNTTIAPECQALAPSDMIPPGGTATDEVEEPGTEKYQCCIHPWMRTTVTARGS
jgi:plastocyanin